MTVDVFVETITVEHVEVPDDLLDLLRRLVAEGFRVVTRGRTTSLFIGDDTSSHTSHWALWR